MKTTLLILLSLALLVSACTPAAAGVQAVGLPSVAVTAADSTAEPSPTSNHSALPGMATPVSADRSNKDDATLPGFTNPDFLSPDILGRPTDSSITISALPSSGMRIFYKYGTVPGVYTTQTLPQNASAGQAIEFLLEGLQPDTRYYYRAVYDGQAGREGDFTTARSPGETFRFGVQGDSHPERVKNQFNADLYEKTLSGAAADGLDFYITMGDDFSVDALKSVTAETVAQQYISQRSWLGLVGAPLFLVNGNHEQAALVNYDGSSDNVAAWAQNARNLYYPQPGPDDFYSGNTTSLEGIGPLRDYYAFTWGDALFVVIDPYWSSPVAVDNAFGAGRNEKSKRDPWQVTLGDAQYAWLKQTLEGSRAKYKFVFAHHVNGFGRGGVEIAGSYEWGDAAGLAAHRPGWEKTIHQLFVDNGVTIFFQGHDHIFARQELAGVIYQTLPEPANPAYSYENRQSYTEGDILPNSGRLRVTVAPEGVTVEYIRSFLDKPDETAFTYTVPSRGAHE